MWPRTSPRPVEPWNPIAALASSILAAECLSNGTPRSTHWSGCPLFAALHSKLHGSAEVVPPHFSCCGFRKFLGADDQLSHAFVWREVLAQALDLALERLAHERLVGDASERACGRFDRIELGNDVRVHFLARAVRGVRTVARDDRCFAHER